jgi:hypothetical protein
MAASGTTSDTRQLAQVEPAWRASERARCGVTEPTTESRIKVTGLAVMGANLARNIARYYSGTCN